MRSAAESEQQIISRSENAGERIQVDGPRQSAFSALIFFVLVCSCCAWILHLPLFPSQDGPAHVYYARVTRDLLLGGHGYDAQFRIARPFPPYSVHAYVLMALCGVTSGEMAEKLLACLSIIVLGCGVFLLARQLGRSTIFAAFAAPFLLNRYLFLGFYGYVLGMGFALMGIALWLGHDRRSRSRRVAFLLLTLLSLFSHPVPYLLVVAFCWGEAALGWWNTRRVTASHSEGQLLQRPTIGDFAALDAVSALLLYVAHYSHSGPLWTYEWRANWDLKLLRIVDVFRGWIELPLKVSFYDWVLGISIVALTYLALRQASRESKHGVITRVQAVVGFALLVLVALPVLPRTMNGSGFFADRFSIWPPLLLIASASAWQVSRKMERVLAIIAIAVTAVALVTLSRTVDKIARKLDVASFPANSLSGDHLLAVSDTLPSRALTYDPYLYSPVRLVDRGGALLVGAPWLELQIMILDDAGPQAIVNNKGQVQILPGPQAPVGVVDVRCDGSPSSVHLSPSWRLHRFGCFDIWQPGSTTSR